MKLVGNRGITQSATQKFSALFTQQFEQADHIQIAVGYISVEAVQWLIESIQSELDYGSPKSLDLVVGMHFYEGISRGQFKALAILHNLLQAHNLGGVYIVYRTLFHGKCYLFLQAGIPRKGTIGSSNLSGIVDSESTSEIDVEISDASLLEQMQKSINNLKTKLAIPFDNWTNPKFLRNTPKLQTVPGIAIIDPEELAKILNQKTNIQFPIKIKTLEDNTGKSNLNCYFGEGRRDKRGQVRRRPWYEVEIIVSNTITSKPNYPRDSTFEVVTTDGWQFECKTQGDDSKNLRSTPNLSILGMWLKGKLEDNGVLQLGDAVTQQTLLDYGRSDLILSKTKIPNVWLMEF